MAIGRERVSTGRSKRTLAGPHPINNKAKVKKIIFHGENLHTVKIQKLSYEAALHQKAELLYLA